MTSTKMLTRASNRQNKDVESKHIINENFENNETIEILVEDDEDEHEIEYIITESVELDEQYGNLESNDEAQSIDVSGDAFELQPLIKENDGSDDDSEDEDEKILDTDDPGKNQHYSSYNIMYNHGCDSIYFYVSYSK